MMLRLAARGALLLALLSPGIASAQDLPDVPPSLSDAAGTVCVRVVDDGRVTDAFIVTSTGDSARDGALLVWVRKLRLPPAEPGKARRENWSPMPIAFGDARLPVAPKNCAPAESANGGAATP